MWGRNSPYADPGKNDRTVLLIDLCIMTARHILGFEIGRLMSSNYSWLVSPTSSRDMANLALVLFLGFVARHSLDVLGDDAENA